jgi:hypothetical protein
LGIKGQDGEEKNFNADFADLRMINADGWGGDPFGEEEWDVKDKSKKNVS